MRRAVERYLEDPMAEELLRGNIKAGDTLTVRREGAKLAFLTAQAPELPALPDAASSEAAAAS